MRRHLKKVALNVWKKSTTNEKKTSGFLWLLLKICHLTMDVMCGFHCIISVVLFLSFNECRRYFIISLLWVDIPAFVHLFSFYIYYYTNNYSFPRVCSFHSYSMHNFWLIWLDAIYIFQIHKLTKSRKKNPNTSAPIDENK